MKRTNMITIVKGLLYAALALFLVGSVVNCGGGESSMNPADIKAPKTMIQDFIAKHDIMIDNSLVDFYVPDEKPSVAAAVKQAIEMKKSTGELEKLQRATFDFSNLKVTVVDAKDAYVHDEPRQVIKVAVSGSYDMKAADASTTIPTDRTVILEKSENGWKVTEKVNPWQEYKYNKS